MKNFDSRTYSINDFVEWNNRKQLELSPKFQRRKVWSPQAKSYLIDTVLKSKPIPKIFIRSRTEPETRITVREIVDGQQRLRTIIEYLEDGFRVSKVHNKEFGGLLYSELPDNVQRDFLNYELSVDLLIDLPDKDILDIFARLNTYAVKLNRQELLNAQYFGAFKMLVYDLGYEYTKFWTDNGIFTNNNIMRMEEAALTSDIIASIVENEIVDSKNLEKVYKKYDNDLPNDAIVRERFTLTMDYIGTVFRSINLKESAFSRQPLFYSLFMCLYHMNYGLNDINVPRMSLNSSNISKVRNFVSAIDTIISDEKLEKENVDFISSISKATTDQRVRRIRTRFLCQKLFEAIA